MKFALGDLLGATELVSMARAQGSYNAHEKLLHSLERIEDIFRGEE